MSSSDSFSEGPSLSERMEPAPATFEQCIRQAQSAVGLAMADGYNLLEVEFPPLSADFLEDAGSSAYDVSSANVRLAGRFARSFAADGKNVAVMLPDEAELERAVDDEGGEVMSPGVMLKCLRASGSRTAGTFDQLLLGVIGRNKGAVQPVDGVDMYVCIGASCQELPDVEELHNAAPGATIIFFNLKLDTLRGDLGLPAFPPKDLHYRFLSKVKPAYLLRTRAYSRSLSKPPFLVNYQGAQFRVYPGGYQCLLDTGKRYKMVVCDKDRQSLGDFKDVITKALRLDEDEGGAMSFFRKGFKTKTWWEERNDLEQFDNWRT
ncbi:unnamed protein product [Discosporangium mesarthrocarpum]